MRQETIKVVFVVEIESGSSDEGGAMIFDSVWSSKEKAEKYSKVFKHRGYLDHGLKYSITEIEIDKEG